MSINWNDYDFEPIESLDTWDPPSYGGIYAITYKKDPVNKSNIHTILYFGETEDFSERGIGPTHHKYDCWKRHSNQTDLYVSVHRDDDENSRKAKEKKLIESRNPPCNSEYN